VVKASHDHKNLTKVMVFCINLTNLYTYFETRMAAHEAYKILQESKMMKRLVLFLLAALFFSVLLPY